MRVSGAPPTLRRSSRREGITRGARQKDFTESMLPCETITPIFNPSRARTVMHFSVFILLEMDKLSLLD